MKLTKQEFYRKIEEGVSLNHSKEAIVGNFCEAIVCQNCEMFNKNSDYFGTMDCAEIFDKYYDAMVRKKKLEKLLS